MKKREKKNRLALALGLILFLAVVISLFFIINKNVTGNAINLQASGNPSITGNAITLDDVGEFFKNLIGISDGDESGEVLMAPGETYGDSVLHLGATGYATRADADVQDLDYTKDFSVEALIKIDTYSTGGNVASIIRKTASNDGFRIEVSNNNQEVFGKSIQAVIGDGTTIITFNPGLTAFAPSRYEGYVYVVMSWDVNKKNLTMYMNGAKKGEVGNVAINPANIDNNGALIIGSTGSSHLGRDVFLARLWNRKLSDSEVTNLYNNFNSTGKHTIPAGFNSANLVSEWLMQNLSNSSGGIGTTYILDTRGNNHLNLTGGAEVLFENGNLALVYPIDGATDVDKAVTLQASGGLGDIPNSVRPLQYYFQVDEVNTFDSSNLKESGWLVHYGQWQPILEPNQQYFWRVKVKESGTALESSYTSTYSFTTEDSQDWYVRPLGGSYGLEDGTSYDNAWTTIKNITWGENGVEAGDNLYVCGEHVLKTGTVTAEFIQASGFSNEFPITIRMDCKDKNPSYEDGELWSITNLSVVWTGPDTNGVWTTTSANKPLFEFNGTDYLVLTGKNKTTTTWTDDLGYYNVSGNTIYYKPYTGTNPTGRMFRGANPDNGNNPTTYTGYAFFLGRSSYINFYKCKFFNTKQFVEEQYSTSTGKIVTVTASPVSHHITWDSSEFAYLQTTVFNPTAGNNFWTLKNSKIHDSANGLYSSGSGGVPDPSQYNILIENNLFYNIGNIPLFQHKDGHSVGSQYGVNWIIQNNTILNSNDAICFWGSGAYMNNNTIRYNFIKDIWVASNTGGHGIDISGSSSAYPGRGYRENFKIYGNIIMNTGLGGWDDWQGKGISSNSPDHTEIYNNVIINSGGTGISISTNDATYTPNFIINASIYNNIIINPGAIFPSRAFFLGLGGGNCSKVVRFYPPIFEMGSWDIRVGNNLFYNSSRLSGTGFGPGSYYLNGVSYSPNLTVGAIFADPKFVDAENGNFKLQEGSPAINNGTDLD